MHYKAYILYIFFALVAFSSPLNYVSAASFSADLHSSQMGSEHSDADSRPVAKKILVIGDSMTGWLAERMAAYGKSNDFEVATVIWDGSTINKWANNSNKITGYINQTKPDAVFICLGLNELAEKNPQTRYGAAIDKIKNACGNIPIIWVGPPTWPGKQWGEPLNGWLESKMGSSHYFNSLPLKLSRQSGTNPHPSRDGISRWVDAIIDWIPANGAIRLPSYNHPTTPHIRPATYIYRKMSQPL